MRLGQFLDDSVRPKQAEHSCGLGCGTPAGIGIVVLGGWVGPQIHLVCPRGAVAPRHRTRTHSTVARVSTPTIEGVAKDTALAAVAAARELQAPVAPAWRLPPITSIITTTTATTLVAASPRQVLCGASIQPVRDRICGTAAAAILRTHRRIRTGGRANACIGSAQQVATGRDTCP